MIVPCRLGSVLLSIVDAFVAGRSEMSPSNWQCGDVNEEER